VKQIEIVKWGNSCAVRLPAAAMKNLKIALGDRMELETVEGALVLKPTAKIYHLKYLLAQINDQNRHEFVDWGTPVGREVW